MIDTIKVSSRGQVVIPEKFRELLKIKEGSKLIVTENNNKLIIELEEKFLTRINKLELNKEDEGWLAISENSMKKLWDNPKDDKEWKKYL